MLLRKIKRNTILSLQTKKAHTSPEIKRQPPYPRKKYYSNLEKEERCTIYSSHKNERKQKSKENPRGNKRVMKGHVEE
jgi:hypothetical protein